MTALHHILKSTQDCEFTHYTLRQLIPDLELLHDCILITVLLPPIFQIAPLGMGVHWVAFPRGNCHRRGSIISISRRI
jgi:hypothetical protein